jgi:hypothetical protein
MNSGAIIFLKELAIERYESEKIRFVLELISKYK